MTRLPSWAERGGRGFVRKARIRIIWASALMVQRREVLADFEAELIAEVRARIRRDPASVAAVTPAEWQVIDDALAALFAAPDQPLSELAA